MTHILITGASGFVGLNLTKELISSGYHVRAAVTQIDKALPSDQVVINRLEKQVDWSTALQGIDIVIHLAARVHVMNDKNEAIYYQVNSDATKILAEQAAKNNVKRFIFLSSIKVNGESTTNSPAFKEENMSTPDDAYGHSKLLAEQYIQSISKQTGMEFVIIRPPLIYGPGVKANFLKMVKLVNKAWPLPFAKVKNQRHFIFLDNLISAICKVIEEPKAANQIFLVSDRDCLSLPQIMRYIALGLGVNLKLISVSPVLLTHLFKLFGLNSLNTRLLGSLELNTDKIQTKLGWIPPVSAADGLVKTAQWYRQAKL